MVEEFFFYQFESSFYRELGKILKKTWVVFIILDEISREKFPLIRFILFSSEYATTDAVRRIAWFWF